MTKGQRSGEQDIVWDEFDVHDRARVGVEVHGPRSAVKRGGQGCVRLPSATCLSGQTGRLLGVGNGSCTCRMEMNRSRKLSPAIGRSEAVPAVWSSGNPARL
jgi:hypothetical protein